MSNPSGYPHFIGIMPFEMLLDERIGESYHVGSGSEKF